MQSPWIATVASRKLLTLVGLGIAPVGQVFGASVRAISLTSFPITTCLVQIEMDAYYQMLDECLQAVHAEAERLSANGVVDCQLTYETTLEGAPAGYRLLRMQMIGTGVLDERNLSSQRYVAACTATELLGLHRAGFQPCGLAVGHCSFYQVAWRQKPKRGPLGSWMNEEVAELTQGPYTAREIAMSRMTDMAQKCGGVGIVAVKYQSSVIPSGSLVDGTMAAVCRMSMIGTAIRRNPKSDSEVSISLAVKVN